MQWQPQNGPLCSGIQIGYGLQQALAELLCIFVAKVMIRIGISLPLCIVVSWVPSSIFR